MARKRTSRYGRRQEAGGGRRQWIIWGLVGVAVVAFLGFVGYFLWLDLQPVPLLGVEVRIVGADHIPEGQLASDHNSDPPTSGEHYSQPAEAGFYEEAPADEYLVHNLEHGYIVVYYNCEPLDESECASLKNDLQEAMADAGVGPVTRTPKIIVAPRPGMENLITYTSWGRMYRVDQFDRDEFALFVEQNREISPEPRGR